METGLDIFAKMQYGIAAFTVILLLVGWIRPKLLRLRAQLAAKAAAATASVADAALPEPSLGRVKAE